MTGVFIRNMEIPPCCFDCALRTDWGTCGYYSIAMKISGMDVPYDEHNERRENCPLVQITFDGFEHGFLSGGANANTNN